MPQKRFIEFIEKYIYGNSIHKTIVLSSNVDAIVDEIFESSRNMM